MWWSYSTLLKKELMEWNFKIKNSLIFDHWQEKFTTQYIGNMYYMCNGISCFLLMISHKRSPVDSVPLLCLIVVIASKWGIKQGLDIHLPAGYLCITYLDFKVLQALSKVLENIKKWLLVYFELNIFKYFEKWNTLTLWWMIGIKYWCFSECIPSLE